ncbi:hypothetical protein ACHAXM_010001 [Skeletonema potamos]|jgi:hypothetical protein
MTAATNSLCDTGSSKWTVHDTCQSSSFLPTIGVTLFLGWNGILSCITLYALFLASSIERAFILALCVASLSLPPRWPGPIGRKIGWWMVTQSEKYFGLKTIVEDEQELLQISKGNRGTIYAMEPHDILPFAAFSFSPIINRIPGGRNICFLVSSAIFRIPFLRQIYSWAGSLPVDKETFLSRLEAGKSLAFVPGGVKEVLLKLDPLHKPRDLVLYLRNRKGFIKLALQTGSPIVPVFCFHLDGSYRICWLPRGKLMEAFARWAGCFPLLYWGRWNILQGIPRPNQLTVVIGRPIHVPKERFHVSGENVDKYHGIFLKELEGLFERHKEAEGYGDTHLKIV